MQGVLPWRSILAFLDILHVLLLPGPHLHQQCPPITSRAIGDHNPHCLPLSWYPSCDHYMYPYMYHAGSATMALHIGWPSWTFYMYFYFLGPHLHQQYPPITSRTIGDHNPPCLPLSWYPSCDHYMYTMQAVLPWSSMFAFLGFLLLLPGVPSRSGVPPITSRTWKPDLQPLQLAMGILNYGC